MDSARGVVPLGPGPRRDRAHGIDGGVVVATAPTARPAAYSRCSTSEQSTLPQILALRAYAERAGLGIPEEFADQGVSGRLASRPEFDRLRLAISAGNVDVVLATKLDRISRSVKDALEFFSLCDEHGVRVVVVDQGFDTSTASGRLVRTILAAIGEFEAELVRDRTRAALAAIKSGARRTRTGNPVGRPPILTAELLERIRKLRDTPDERGKRRTWPKIATIVHSPAGSCRKWYAAYRGATPGVINPSAGFGTNGDRGGSTP